MKKIFLFKLFCMVNLVTHAQTIVNREWTQFSGTPDPLAIVVSCIDYQNNVITASSDIIMGQDANISVIKYATDGNIIWQNSFNGVSNGKDYSTAVKTDMSGNIYLLGATFNSSSSYDFLLIKYNELGVEQWQAVYNGSGNSIDVPTSLALDISGNIYIIGATSSPNSLTDFATIKYSNSGVQQWVKLYDFALGYEAPVGIEINPSNNNIYVTGASASTAASNNWDYATLEYNSSGGQINVSRVASTGNGLDKPTAITRDNSGNIYITGSSFNSTNNSYDIKTIKLNSSLAFQWEKTFNGDNLDDQANSLDVDASGNVYVAGYVKRSATGENSIVLKYSTTGVLLWQKEIYEPGVVGDERGNQVVVDINGNAYVTGSYRQNGNKNFISLKIAPDGNVNWQDILSGNSSGDDEASSINVTAWGDVIVSGKVINGGSTTNATIRYESINIDLTNLGNNGVSKYLKNEVVIKFNPAIINPAFSENIAWQFAPINDVIPQNLVTTIKDALGLESTNRLILVKVYDWMTPSDNITVARDGKHVTMDKLWSTFRLTLPMNLDENLAVTALAAIIGDIEFAHLNCIMEKCDIPNDTYCASAQASLVPTQQFPNANINMNSAWDIQKGKSDVRVGVVDGLINYTHEDLGGGTFQTSKVIDGEEFGTGVPIENLNNYDWHGTACAGIIGGVRHNNNGIAGIAGGDGQPNSGISLISLATSSLSNTSVANAIAKGASHSYGNGLGYYCNVINLSFGEANSFPVINQSLKLAQDNKCVIVAARGNRFSNEPQGENTQLIFPACYSPWILNIGSSGNNGGHKTLFNGDIFAQGLYESKFEGDVDFIAPGSSDIVLTTRAGTPDQAMPTFSNNKYTWFSGTSAAAPMLQV
jgi:hypothetical protein